MVLPPPPPTHIWPPLVVVLEMLAPKFVPPSDSAQSTTLSFPDVLLMVPLDIIRSVALKVRVASPPAVLAIVTPELNVIVPVTSLSTLVPVFNVVA